LGPWHGILFVDEYAYVPKVSFIIERSSDENGIHATGFRGGARIAFDIRGSAGPEVDGVVPVEFELTYNSYLQVDDHFEGKLDVQKELISGRWSNWGSGGDFVFKRKAEFIRFYPAPATVKKAPARSRWEFAYNSIRYNIRRELRTMQFFLERFKIRKRYIELATRGFNFGKPLDSNQLHELQKMYTYLDPADTRFYTSLVNLKVATTSANVYVNSHYYQACLDVICFKWIWVR
jgi:hypothetical protein